MTDKTNLASWLANCDHRMLDEFFIKLHAKGLTFENCQVQNAVNPFNPFLHWTMVAESGDIERAKILLKHQIPLRGTRSKHGSVLRFAKTPEMLEFLLQNCTSDDIEMTDKHGYTAILSIALEDEANQLQKLLILIKYGAKIDINAFTYDSIFQFAARIPSWNPTNIKRNIEILKMFGCFYLLVGTIQFGHHQNLYLLNFHPFEQLFFSFLLKV
jgi:hypothetical protein